MGTRNSPGASGRFGTALICLTVGSSPIFQGVEIVNSAQSYAAKNVHHLTYSERCVLLGEDVLLAV